MRIEVVTLFPALVEAGLAAGVLGRAVATGRLEVGFENPRGHALDAHRTVDDRPFGGGPGMVMKAEPLAKAIATARSRLPTGAPVIGLAAHGLPFDQAAARRLAGLAGFGLVAGRYEGIDQRASDALIHCRQAGHAAGVSAQPRQRVSKRRTHRACERLSSAADREVQRSARQPLPQRAECAGASARSDDAAETH
jgi:hypothetical protein